MASIHNKKDLLEFDSLVYRDQEFKSLVAEANKLTESFWYTDSDTLCDIWEHTLNNLSIKEFFLNYKCTVAWVIIVARILSKLYARDINDMSNAINIPGTTKYAVIYPDTLGAKPMFWFNPNTDIYYTAANLAMYNPTRIKPNKYRIEFLLERPKYDVDKNSINIVDSLMNIRINTYDDNDILGNNFITVKGFTLSILTGILRRLL